MLRLNSWWLRDSNLVQVATSLGFDTGIKGFLLPIRVWLPDLQFPVHSSLVCPCGHANVKSWGFRESKRACKQ